MKTIKIEKFDEKQANNILKYYLDKYNIEVLKWSVSSCGRAYWNKNAVKIPRPTDIDRFGVCMHEIKHIIDGNIKPRYVSEFRCDKFALDIIDNLGWENTLFKARMKWHVLSRVAMATNRGHKNVDSIISNYYTDIDFTKWYDVKTWVGVNRVGNRSNVDWWKPVISNY